jgi:heme-degrading monooxygenase HmoA
MYARISRYKGDAELLRSGFESVSDELAQVDGFSHALFLADRDTGRAMSITMWESEAAMEASAERAHQMRTRASEPAQATIESVEGYEVLLTVEATASA